MDDFRSQEDSPRVVQQLLTPKQVARAIGVSESSLKRWCDQGVIPTVRTAGGHRRLPIQGVMTFLRDTQRSLAHPELLGLPSTTGRGERIVQRATDQLFAALVAGDDSVCRQIMFDLYLAGQRLSVIFDEVIAVAFHQIGEQWECGEVEIYEERRACEICERAMYELRSFLPAVEDPAAPRAMGGSVEGDPYRLPTLMAECVLRELGCHAASLGSSLPFATMQAAIDKHQPDLFWISASSIADPASFLPAYQNFHAAVGAQTSLVVGGRALDESLRKQMKYAAYCDNFQHLEAFVATWQRSRG